MTKQRTGKNCRGREVEEVEGESAKKEKKETWAWRVNGVFSAFVFCFPSRRTFWCGQPASPFGWPVPGIPRSLHSRSHSWYCPLTTTSSSDVASLRDWNWGRLSSETNGNEAFMLLYCRDKKKWGIISLFQANLLPSLCYLSPSISPSSLSFSLSLSRSFALT